jgi:hypothetical protein
LKFQFKCDARLLTFLCCAGVPRANKAVSVEAPDGSPAHLAREDYTVMQQHVAFFDRCVGVLIELLAFGCLQLGSVVRQRCCCAHQWTALPGDAAARGRL